MFIREYCLTHRLSCFSVVSLRTQKLARKPSVGFWNLRIVQSKPMVFWAFGKAVWVIACVIFWAIVHSLGNILGDIVGDLGKSEK